MKIESTPLVSICIPTYNGELYIAEALESAIQQTYPNLEIVVTDDASRDDTLLIVDGFKSKTSIPIYIHKHTPAGIGSNWNFCVSKANGAYIKFLFQDDVLLSDCIERMMALMVNPKVGMVYSKRDFIIDDLTEKNKQFIAYYGNLHHYWENLNIIEGVISGKDYLKDRQFLNSPKNKIGEPSNVLLRKECFEKVGYFDEVLEQALDSDYWYRVMRYYDIGFLDEVLAKFRLHASQASSINKSRDIPDKELVYKNYYHDLFWYLDFNNQLKLLKLYHPLVKTLVHLKNKITPFKNSEK